VTRDQWVVITLSEDGLNTALQVGFIRLMNAYRMGLRPSRARATSVMLDLAQHPPGACAELSVAHYTRTLWTGAEDRFGRDTGAGEVKWDSQRRDRYQLRVPVGKAQADERYWLVTGDPPVMLIIGWAWGFELLAAPKVDPGSRGPMYCIDEAELHPPTDYWGPQ
jgi:hypothetical protein